CTTDCLRVASSSGRFFAFSTTASLTGYDNTDAVSGGLDIEIYVYDALARQLTCASCGPSGQQPLAGGAYLTQGEAPHPLTDSGRLFFNTAEPLLPRDTNGKVDVYEFEDGQVSLISTGTGTSEAVLLDASENGGDVFFLPPATGGAGHPRRAACDLRRARIRRLSRGGN